MKESNISTSIRLHLSPRGIVLFKNVAGLFFTRDGRPVKAGLINGFSDLCGWRTVEITSDMVGKKIAQIVCIEVKTETGRIRPEQAGFIAAVQSAGGIAGIARSPQDAQSLVDGWAPSSR